MIPDYQTLILPILRLAGAGSFRTVEAVEQVANEFHLTSEERAELLPAGRQTILANRVHWALAQLSRAKLLNRLRQGIYEITDLGTKVLANPPPRIDIVFLSRFDRLDHGGTDASESVQPLAHSERKANLAPDTPDERIETALADLNTALRADLLERVQAMTPNRFEKLVIDLMLGMRYGAAGSGKHLGRTSDGGVDGIINEDVLGLDVIYLQAKRYASDNVIGVEKIREFAGALDERGATRGVFVTTSRFAAPARAYAERSHKRLVLIEGEQLARLLVEYGVGVRTYRTVEMKEADAGYFE
jgi:restriction system protein